MGELHDAVAPPRRAPGPLVLGVLILLAIAAMAVGCEPVAPSGPPASGSGSDTPTARSTTPSAPPASGVPATPGPATIDPRVARLAWLVDRAGRLGVWTTDLAGGDVRTYLSSLDELGTALRGPQPVGDDVVLIRDVSAPELWLLSATAPPRLLLDGVETFVVVGDDEVLAVRDTGSLRSIWRVPLRSGPPTSLVEFTTPPDAPELGPFGFAISPDGQTVAAGWVGGPVEVFGATRATLRDIGAPLVVGDDGRIVAVAGRAGEAYLVEGDRLVELAPVESDPLAAPGSGLVAWASIGDGGDLRAVEVRDLLAGTSQTYPAEGLATNVQRLTDGHVILEAKAFDPQRRSIGVVDRRDGRFGTFDAAAPAGD